MNEEKLPEGMVSTFLISIKYGPIFMTQEDFNRWEKVRDEVDTSRVYEWFDAEPGRTCKQWLDLNTRHAKNCRAHCPDPPTRPDLTKAHGTPQEFERAVWLAYSQLLIDTPEAVTAIERYKREYEAALP